MEQRKRQHYMQDKKHLKIEHKKRDVNGINLKMEMREHHEKELNKSESGTEKGGYYMQETK